MKVTFLQSGESPDFGPFKEGEEKDLDDATAQLLKDRGVCDFSAPSASLREKKKGSDVDVKP